MSNPQATTSPLSLLSILRGTAPAPLPSPSASASASQQQGAGSASLSSYSTAHSSSPSQHGEASSGNASDLDRLFKNAFGGARHPSSASTPGQTSAQASDSEGASTEARRRAMASNGSHAPSPQQQAYDYSAGAIERPSPQRGSPAPAPFVFGAPGGFGGIGAAGQQGQSASLLEMLQQMGAPSPAPAPSAVKQEAEEEERKEGPSAKKARRRPGKEQEKETEGASRGLLETLMGGAIVPEHNEPRMGVEEQVELEREQREMEQREQIQEPAPKFAPFISPFDLLAQAHAKEQAEAQGQPVSPSPSSPAPATRKSKPSALPPHLASHLNFAAASSSPTLDVEDPARAQSPTTPTAASFASPSSPSPSAAATDPTRALLASQYLPSSLPAIPAWAPIGLRLPSSSSATEPQRLEIDLTLPHLDSLLLSPVPHTPVTLFSIPPSYSGVGQRVGIWPRGLVYATGKGRLRVIDRESGTRVLLKGGGKKELVDVAVARGVQAAKRAVGGSGKRVIACVGQDGRLTVWRVMDGCTEESAGSEKLLEIQGHPTAASAGPRFPLLRFHPNFPGDPLLGVALNDGRVFILDLQSVLDGKTESGEEALLYSLGKGAQCGSSIVDFAFSPDGSAFAVLTSDQSYSIRHTSKPTEVILSSKLLEDPSTPAGGLTGVSFLADKDAKPTALVVTSKRGTHVRIVPLRRGAEERDTSISFVLPASSDVQPALHFSHHAYSQFSTTLYLSSSLRGSLFAFRLSFAPRASILSSSHSSDAAFLASLPSEAPGVSDVRLEHVSEVPTSDPVLGFALDDGHLVKTSEGQDAMGALVMHPKGIHQVLFVRQQEAVHGGREEVDLEDLGAGGRRMSLESSIHVSSEVEVVIDEADTVPMGMMEIKVDTNGEEEGESALETGPAESMGRERRGSSSLSIKREPSITPIEEEPPVLPTPSAEQPAVALSQDTPTTEFVTSPTIPSVEPSADSPPTASAATPLAQREIKLSGSAVNAAIRSMKAKNKGSAASPTPTSPVSERAIKLESPSPAPALSLPETQPQPQQVKSPAVASSSKNDPIANAWATGVPVPKKSKKEEANAELLKELRKLEEGLPAKIAKLVGNEMEKHAQRAEEERLNEQAADTARQETMLKLVSTTLAKSTSRLVESTIKDQIKQQVIPSIGKLVSAAVQEQVGAGLAAGLKETLPNEMEKVLLRPDVTAHLSRNFSSSIAPSLERSLMAVVTQGVIPPFNQLLGRAVDACVSSVHREMVDVRKEIVKEQSEAVIVLEEEVHLLRRDVTDLKAALERMEGLVISLRSTPPQAPQAVAPPPPAPAVVSPRQQQQQFQQAQQRPQQRQTSSSYPQQQQEQSPYSLPPIPRAQTPPEAYEETFTNVLQPQHEPAFSSLVHLINSSPASRQDVVFPPAPRPPKLSPPVILSLAYRLAQVIASDDSPLNDDGRKQLGWLRRSVTSMDPSRQSPEVAEFTPRILESVVTSLHTRAKQLHAIQDRRGLEELRGVEAYARAQLRIFAEGGVRESFRR